MSEDSKRMPSNISEFDRSRFESRAETDPAPGNPPTGRYLAFGTLSGVTIFSLFVPIVNVFVSPFLILFSIFYGWRTMRSAT